MKFCQICGKEIIDENVGCESCNNSNQQNVPDSEKLQNVFQTDTTNKINPPATKKMNIMFIAIAIAVFVAVIGIISISSGTDSPANTKEESKISYEEAYIQAAKSIMYEFMKNPSSAVFYDAYLVETDDYGRGIVYLDFSAENTLGGSNRSRVYVCVQEVNLDGKYKFYRDFCYVSVSSSDAGYMSDMKMNTLKSTNQFGEPKA